MRGKVTDNIKVKAKELLGINNLSNRELRLMPYLQYIMINNQVIEPNKINQEERHILSNWIKQGWIEDEVSGLKMSKLFWDAINEILWLGYVTAIGEN